MKTLKKVIPTEEFIKEGHKLCSFASAIPNYLGINLCSIENIEIECADDEFGQLVSLKINAKHHELTDKEKEDIRFNGGPFPWLVKKEDGTVE